jgi:PKD repeat protein
LVVDFSSRSATSTSPEFATDFSSTNLWTTASGQVTDQWFKLALLKSEDGRPYLIDRIQMQGSSSSNGAHDFELRVSTTGFVDPATSDDATRLDDPNFRTVLTGTLPQDNLLHWFTFPPVHATHVQLVVRNTHSDSATSMTLNTLRVFSPVRGGAAVPFDDHSVDPGGRVVSWDWDFGDGQTSTEQHPVHAYEAPGTYRVTLRVTDDEDFSDTVSFVYTVLRPPAVSYTPAVIEPLVEGQSVPFRDTSTDALGDPIMARLWTLSHQLDTSLSPVNVSFPDNVDVTVSLSVTDNQFMNAALTRVFTPENVPPTVNAGNDFSISWGVPFRTLANGMDFRDVSADIGPTAGAVCDVDYGDGQTVQVLNCTSGAVNNIFHAYAEPGVYTMVLVVTDKDGGVGSDTRTITALRRDSHVTIWGEDALRPPEGGGPVVAHARLVDFDPSDRHAPVAGRTITFSLGAETQDVVTSASGEAQATFHYAPGRSDRIVASFAGDSFYEPSMDRPFILGDLVAAVGDGMAHRHDAAGNFVNVFDSRTGSSETAGMCFDSADNLYLTSFQASRASKFNRSTGQVITNWAVGFSQKPESCVLAREDIDGDGEPDDVLYFGEVDGQELIRKFDTHGNLLGTFDPETRDRGVDWIDLAADGRTMYYTTEGDDILRYDIVADVQLPDFVPDQTVATNRFLPRADSLPENAIDADVNSTWLTEVTLATNEWFIVDLIGETQTIKGVFIEGSTSLQAVRNFHVQVSTTGTDEADFTTVLTEVSPRNNIGASFTFPAVDARFVRLFAIDNYGGSNIGVNQFKVFNTADQNVASLEGGATIVGVSSVRSDPLLTGPCFALRLLQDQSVLMACRGEVVHVSPDGRSLLASYSRAALGVPTTDTLFALNLDPDGTSFWTAAHSAARIVKAHIATGEVLLSFDAKKRGPTVAGLIVYGEPTAAVNSAPIADDQSLTTGENTPLAITLTARDPESDPLTFSIVTQPAHGVLSGIAPDIVYTPGLDFVGVDSFTFKANDGELDSNVATVAIEVLLVNSAPVANTGGPYVTVEGAMLMLDGTSSFDPDQRDQDTLTFEWDTDGDGEFNDAFTPTVEVSYPDLGLFTVALRVTDKHGASDQANTIVLVNTEPPTIGAGPDQEVDPGQTVNLAPATFTDPGAVDTHTATINWGDGTQTPGVVTQAPGGGTVDGSHVYLSAGMFTVLVCVTDDDGGTGCDTLTVTVNAITNAPPMADAGGPYSVDEGGSITLDGSASFDPDEGDSIVQFEWDLDGDGEFDDAIGATPTFSAALLDGPQTVTVRLRVTDAFGATAAGEADITVENVPPTAEEDLAVTDEYVSVSIDVLANDTDPAGTNDTLAITAVTDGAHGTVVVDDRGTADPADDLVVYTPALGFDGTDSFTYTISDGDGGTATGTVKVTVRNLVDLAGRVFDDLDNDGRFESNAGEVGIGGVTVELFDQTTGTLIGTQATAEDGTYAFDANLGAGIYKIVAVQATGYLDGSETAGNLGGTVDNTQDSNEIADIVVGTANASSDGVDYLFAEIRPSLIQGLVWNDFDNDGEVDFGEFGISDVEITLNGTDDRAGTVSLTQTTDAQGNYQFADLRPGSYEIIETQPGQPIHSVDYIDGKDVVGEVNGVLVGDNDGGSPPLSPTNDQFTGLLLAVPDSIGINYNFGERVDGGGFSSGQTATIGYWQNRNGKQLIQLLNGSADSTLLASWLSSTFPNMYAALGDSNGDGVADDPLTNAGVAELYQRLFRLNSQTAPPGPPKLDAQVLAVALSAYATEESFVVVDFATGAHDPTLVDQIESFGFDVTLGGVGARFFNVGGGGAAFNVADDSRVKIVDLLLATDAMSLVGLLYDDADSDGTGDGSIDDFERMLRVLANDVYTGINET